jgi:hypothetical protein
MLSAIEPKTSDDIVETETIDQSRIQETSADEAVVPWEETPAVREIEAIAGPSIKNRLSCENAIDLMGVYLAHDMNVSQRELFVDHIRHCPECHEKLLALEMYLHIVAKVPV